MTNKLNAFERQTDTGAFWHRQPSPCPIDDPNLNKVNAFSRTSETGAVYRGLAGWRPRPIATVRNFWHCFTRSLGH